jgi:Fe-S-cluster containining protein
MDPARTLTTAGTLSVAGREIEFQINVPEGPARPAQLLPLFRSLADAIVGAVVGAVQDEGKAISCRAGCGACCRQLVPISEIEARRLAQVVDEAPAEHKAEIVARFKRALGRLEQAGLLGRLKEAAETSTEQRRALGLDYFRLGIPCPFLENESCGIYEERPIACREYLVTSPASECAGPAIGRVERVKVPLEVSKTLRSFGASAEDHSRRWVPLVLALQWVCVHTSDEALRFGPELVCELFSKLTGQALLKEQTQTSTSDRAGTLRQ